MSRHLLPVALTISLLGAVPAGTQTPQAPVAPVVPVVVVEQEAQQTMQQLRQVLRQYPPSVREILRLDPSLLNRSDYMASYPILVAFLAQHPDIARNPAYYLGQPFVNDEPPASTGVRVAREVREMMWGFCIVLIVATIFGVLGWIVRQIIDYRRWLRVSAAQKDVQSKLMDRLTSSQELLAYLESPAGRRMLESGGAPADALASQRVAAPVNRILWSIQVGVVLIVVGGAVWTLFPGSASPDVVQAFRFLGAVVVAVGLGFVLSALVSWTLSIRLGLMGRVQSQS